MTYDVWELAYLRTNFTFSVRSRTAEFTILAVLYTDDVLTTKGLKRVELMELSCRHLRTADRQVHPQQYSQQRNRR